MRNTFAFIYRDLDRGRRVRCLTESANMRAELFTSIDALMERNWTADFAAVLVQEPLSRDSKFQMLREYRRDGNCPLIITLSSSDDDRLGQSEVGTQSDGLFKEPIAGEVLIDFLRWLLRHARRSERWSSDDALIHVEQGDDEALSKTIASLRKFPPFDPPICTKMGRRNSF